MIGQLRAPSHAHLLRLYPRAWRNRYEDEFLAVLEERPPTSLQLVDIVLGALDAHVSREIPAAETASTRRPKRSWIMSRNLYAASAIAAAPLLLFVALGDSLGLEFFLAIALIPFMLASLTAATIGLARRSTRRAPATAGAALTALGAIASLGALLLIGVNQRVLGFDGWDVATVTLAALLIGQAIVAVSAWDHSARTRPGLALVASGAAWVVVVMAYMEISGNWSAAIAPLGWVVLAAGWLWIGVIALRSPASATA